MLHAGAGRKARGRRRRRRRRRDARPRGDRGAASTGSRSFRAGAVDYKGRTLEEMDLDAHPRAAAAARPGRRARPHQRAGQPPSQALSRRRGTARRRHRRLHDAEHPACREPQRRRRPDHPHPGARDGAGLASSTAPTTSRSIDLTPDDLIQRLKEGKVYVPETRRAGARSIISRPAT